MERVKYLAMDYMVTPDSFLYRRDTCDDDLIVVDTVTGIAFLGTAGCFFSLKDSVSEWLDSPEAKEAGF